MNLTAWAIRWGVSAAAVQDLTRELGLDYADDAAPPEGLTSEAGVLAAARLAHNKAGGRCWRNNSGVLTNAETGRPVRFGLANESAAVNKVLKSSDLIGIKPTLVLPSMVGSTLGLFWAREGKEPGWRYTGTEREVAQLAFINLVLRLGGDARFTNGFNL